MPPVPVGNSLSAKLKERVCEYAHVSFGLLSASADEWLSRRTERWIIERSVSDVELKKAAGELRRRFAGLPERRAESALKQALRSSPATMLTSSGKMQDKHHTHHAHHAHHAAKDVHMRSSTTEPTPATRELNPMDYRTLTTSVTNDRTAAGSPLSLRPQVVRRMQRLNDDSEFIEAFARENQTVEAEHQRLIQEKLQRQAAVRRDMHNAEAFRIAKLEAEREERDRQRHAIEHAMEESRLAELDEKRHRQQKREQERRTIEEQSRLKKRLKDEARKRDLEENQRLKEINLRRDRQKMLEEIEKSSALKSALVSALEDGQSANRSRETGKRQPVGEPTLIFTTRSTGVDNAKEKVHLREQLQTAACMQYADIQESKRAKLDKMDHTAMEQSLMQLKRAEDRERRDKEKALELRAKLVSSLDQELSAQRERKRKEEDEKLELRRRADEEAAEAEHRRVQQQADHKREQEKRRRQMDEQLASRVERMMQPMSIKI